MKKLLFTSALSLFTSIILFAQLGSWSAKANFGGTGRSNAVAFSIGSYGYIGTGYDGTAKKDFWRYDPSSNSWTQMADFGGTARRAATGFAIGNYGYIGTGYEGPGYTKDFWQYDVAGNSWVQVADFGGTARYYASGFSIGTNGYVGTGMNGTTAYNDFWRYNSITDTWTARANFGGTARSDCFAFAINGKGYIGTGRNFSGSTFYNTFYEYDPTADSWTARANFAGTPSAREGIGAFVIGNFGYAGTGSTSTFNTQYTDFYKYDPVGNAWSAVATFTGTQRTNAAAFAIGNYGYLGTGYASSSLTTTFYQFDLCGVTLSVTPTAPSCNGGSNGSLNLTVTGATNPLTYAWSNASTVQDPTGLSSGGYTVTVTDGVGCTTTTTVTVTQPTVIVGNITTVTNASCYSMCNGKITSAASGATPPYSYVWSPSGGTTATATGLCAGSYSVTITDSKGCSTMKDSVVTEPTALTASVTGTDATSACVCDGSVTAIASGGTPSYTYVWAPGNSTTGLCGDITYSVTVTDGNGCTMKDTVSLAPPPLTVSMTITNATCFNCPNGSATGYPSGGAGPFTYSWSTTPAQTTQTATGLVPGTYTVCVTDTNNCTTCSSTFVGFAIGINEISNEDISVSPNPTSGKIQVAVAGGSGSKYSLEIYNVLGEKVFSRDNGQLTMHNGQLSIINSPLSIDLSSQPDGVYFLKLKTETGVVTKKIILNR